MSKYAWKLTILTRKIFPQNAWLKTRVDRSIFLYLIKQSKHLYLTRVREIIVKWDMESLRSETVDEANARFVELTAEEIVHANAYFTSVNVLCFH